MQKESSSGDRHLVGLGRAATEVSQGLAPSPWRTPVPLSPPLPSHQTMVSYSREGSVCATHGASGSCWQRRSLEREGWNVAMVPYSRWQEGTRCEAPAGGEQCPSCTGPALRKALCRVRTLMCLLVGAWAKGSVHLSCSRWDKAWRGSRGEW